VWHISKSADSIYSNLTESAKFEDQAIPAVGLGLLLGLLITYSSSNNSSNNNSSNNNSSNSRTENGTNKMQRMNNQPANAAHSGS